MTVSQIDDRSISARGIAKSIIFLSIPLVIGELGSIAQQFADAIMVGHHKTVELAASGIVNNIFYFVIFFVLGISYAITPLVGNAYGRGDKKETIKILFEGCFLNLIIGVASVLLLGLLLLNIDFLDQPAEVLVYAKPYYKWLMASIPFLTLFLCLKQYLDGLGKTGVSMWIILISNIINILLNWILIFGKLGFPELGLRGAGISTFISRFLQLFTVAIVVASNVIREKRRARISAKDIVPAKSGIINQFKLGFPIGVQLGLELSIFSAGAVFMGWLGTNELAAHQAMYVISTLCFQLLYGIGAANCILISQYCGVGNIAAAKKCPAIAFRLGLSVISIITILIIIFFDPLSTCFTEITGDPNVSADVIHYMRAILPGFVLYQFGDCLQCIYGNSLRGLEDTKPLMLFSFLSYVVICIPICAILGNVNVLGAWGVWLGIPIGLTLAGVLFFIRFKKDIRHLLVE